MTWLIAAPAGLEATADPGCRRTGLQLPQPFQTAGASLLLRLPAHPTVTLLALWPNNVLSMAQAVYRSAKKEMHARYGGAAQAFCNNRSGIDGTAALAHSIAVGHKLCVGVWDRPTREGLKLRKAKIQAVTLTLCRTA